MCREREDRREWGRYKDMCVYHYCMHAKETIMPNVYASQQMSPTQSQSQPSNIRSWVKLSQPKSNDSALLFRRLLCLPIQFDWCSSVFSPKAYGFAFTCSMECIVSVKNGYILLTWVSHGFLVMEITLSELVSKIAMFPRENSPSNLLHTVIQAPINDIPNRRIVNQQPRYFSADFDQSRTV